MFFGEVRIDEAKGLILAHSLRLPSLSLKKGHVLDADDVRHLKAAGINFITGARLDPDDIGENAAAATISDVLAGLGLSANQAFAGRCNLFAEQEGVLVYDRDRLERLNMVDESVTVSALAPYQRVQAGQLIATVKIIPFGVNRYIVDACRAMALRGGALVTVQPFQSLTVGLVLTTLPGVKESVVDSAIHVTRQRVESLHGHITSILRCPHEIGPIERTLAKSIAAGCQLVLVIGATATVDRRDVVPQAIERAGGQIEHFGMPVDPGNLLLLGRLGTVPVVNLPGCARSAKPNGLDWVLVRLMAGLPVKSADLMRMGLGGLLKQTGQRAMAQRPPRPVLHQDWRIAALILAERSSPVAMVELALSAGLEPVVVALPPRSAEEEDLLPACECVVVRSPHDQADQLLSWGIAAIPPDCDGVAIMPSDCPDLSAESLIAMVKAFDPDEGRAVVLPHQSACCALVGSDYFPAVGRSGIAGTAREYGEVVFMLQRNP